MTYEEAIAFWFGRINYEVRSAAPKDLKLERMRALLRRLGDPQERLRIVHVTGTKGKGSTCAMLAAVLRAAGYRVGLFTSPHLVGVEERIRVNGVEITPWELAERMSEVASAVRALEQGPYPPPTFFEISTALGFLHFALRRVEIAVIEVGLGGRFDSTNVCHPLVSVITSIGFDHTAQLGNTLEAIAFQKAGIIKPRVPIVSGVIDEGPRRVIEEVARIQQSPVIQAGRDFSADYLRIEKPNETREPQIQITLNKHSWPPVTLALLGQHQVANAAVVAATIEQLRRVGFSIPFSAVERGFRDVRWPARVEILAKRPAVILDTAHNVPSTEALVTTLRQYFPHGTGRKTVVLGVSSDKPYPEMIKVLAGYFDHFYLTRYGNNPRSVPPEKLAEILNSFTPRVQYSIHTTAKEAWTAARASAQLDDMICITGSVFLAGELFHLVREELNAQ